MNTRILKVEGSSRNVTAQGAGKQDPTFCGEAYTFREGEGLAFDIERRRIWRLLDIVTEIDLSGLTEIVGALDKFHFNLECEDGELSKAESAKLVGYMVYIKQKCCGPLRLKHTLAAIEQCVAWLEEADKSKWATPLRETAAVHVQHVRKLLRSELGETRFYGLARDRAEYYANTKLFGSEIVSAFPSAKNDIVEAMRCIALEVNTAAVFHLMRVAEYGLRALANDRKIEVPKGRPLELATWEDIIKQLEASESRMHGYKATLVREQQFDFYHGAMLEIRRFKNVWRNDIMHTRDEYDRNQALSVFTHVQAFMRILASRVSETSSPMPEIWAEAEYRAD